MTEQEKKQQRANLVIEIEDAQEELNHLREKAYRAANELAEIARRMKAVADVLPTRDDFTPELEIAHRLKPEYETVLNLGELNSLVEELRAARQRRFNLGERRAQLSSSGYTVTV